MSSDLISIEAELVRLSTNLDELTTDFEGLCRVAADARCDYDVEYAKALLRIHDEEDGRKVTQAVKEAQATRECQRYMREARIAEAIMGAAKERIRALQVLISVHQSRLKFLDEGKRF